MTTTNKLEARMRIPDWVFEGDVEKWLKHRLTLVTLPDEIRGQLVDVKVGPRLDGVVSVEYIFEEGDK